MCGFNSLRKEDAVIVDSDSGKTYAAKSTELLLILYAIQGAGRQRDDEREEKHERAAHPNTMHVCYLRGTSNLQRNKKRFHA